MHQETQKPRRLSAVDIRRLKAMSKVRSKKVSKNEYIRSGGILKS